MVSRALLSQPARVKTSCKVFFSSTLTTNDKTWSSVNNSQQQQSIPRSMRCEKPDLVCKYPTQLYWKTLKVVPCRLDFFMTRVTIAEEMKISELKWMAAEWWWKGENGDSAEGNHQEGNEKSWTFFFVCANCSTALSWEEKKAKFTCRQRRTMSSRECSHSDLARESVTRVNGRSWKMESCTREKYLLSGWGERTPNENEHNEEKN